MSSYQLDLGHLVIGDVSVISGEKRTEAELLASAQRGAKQLFREVLDQSKTLKKRRGEESATSVTQLPVPVMRIPREKAPPKPKALTPWEKYAEKKGINLDRKKEKRTWDEAKSEWIDRYGKRHREHTDSKDWIKEMKQDYVAKEDGGDPFLDERRTKKAKADKMLENQKKTQNRAAREKTELGHLDAAARGLATASNGKFAKKKRY